MSSQLLEQYVRIQTAVTEYVAETGSADTGADAEGDETDPEGDREQEEDPLRPAAKLGEEHQVFGAAGTLASMRLRVTAALRLASCHSQLLVEILAGGTTR